MDSNTYTTREAWLHAAIDRMRPWFPAESPVPDTIHVSIGLARNKRHIGVCYHKSASKDGNNHIFVCPTNESDLKILGVLLHELCHAAAPDDAKHGRPFIKIAKHVGLVKPWKSAFPDEATQKKIQAIMDEIGPSPHAQLMVGVTGGVVKQPTRMKLFHCNCEHPVKIRAAVQIDVTCNVCGGKFELQEK